MTSEAFKVAMDKGVSVEDMVRPKLPEGFKIHKILMEEQATIMGLPMKPQMMIEVIGWKP